MIRNLLQITILPLIMLIMYSCEYDQRPYPEFDFSFENIGDLDYIKWECHSRFCLTDSFAVEGHSALQVTYIPPKYGSLRLHHFNPDWSGKDTLAFSILNPSTDSLIMDLRLVDKSPWPPYPDRYNREFRILPGLNTLKLPLKNMKTNETERFMDLRNIIIFDLYFFKLKQKRTFYFDHFYLK